MVFNRFRAGVLLRVLLLAASVSTFAILVTDSNKLVSAMLVGFVAILLIGEIFRYIEKTNRKLTSFFESIRYSDFVSGFTADNKLGKSFSELNDAFNEVLEAFRKARSEKEEHWQYLNTVVQHVGTGLLSFDEEGNVGLINNKARKFMNAPSIRNIDELKESNEGLHNLLLQLKPGSNRLFRPNNHLHLAIHSTEIILKGKTFKLVTLQNIQSELQQKEIEAWQNLTKVLRHEIMNSITPISSLTSTLNEILVEDLIRKDGNVVIAEDTIDDLEEGLNTIRSRSSGLIRFVEAYRDYTTIPPPKIKKIQVAELLDHVANLEKVEIRKAKVKFAISTEPTDIELFGDEELLEMVLINLIKNSIESVAQTANPAVTIETRKDEEGVVSIQVIDNGPGIIPDALERIFVPFYTTKKAGSGIGLALSRQIMQLHNGTLTVESIPNQETVFKMTF